MTSDPRVTGPAAPLPRKGQGDVKLTRDEFARQLGERFYDPLFDSVRDDVARVIAAAWHAYDDYHKSPRTRPAGPGFADPTYELPVEWLAAREAIQQAKQRHDDVERAARILVVCGAARHDQTCPGEMFVSTAMPLCHWPCSCYPNHAMGQVNDWMSEIYPRWVEAHGVLIVTPVYWYQAPSVLKLMIDRLVCADGGNPDPTTTHGKDPVRAKQLELDGWPYPRHLAGRHFSVVVHGDAAGVLNLRRSLADWLEDMHLVAADRSLDRYIGYYEPYATSHDALDRDLAVQEETRNCARALLAAVRRARIRGSQDSEACFSEPRLK